MRRKLFRTILASDVSHWYRWSSGFSLRWLKVVVAVRLLGILTLVNVPLKTNSTHFFSPAQAKA